jgi:hypothetical protein
MRKEVKSHQPDNTSRPGVMQHCTVCSVQLISDEDHIHAYDELYQDSRSHWGVCSCGLEMPNESHSWSVQSGGCSVCGLKYVENTTNENDDILPWILGGAGFALFVVVMIVLVFVIRKKE